MTQIKQLLTAFEKFAYGQSLLTAFTDILDWALLPFKKWESAETSPGIGNLSIPPQSHPTCYPYKFRWRPFQKGLLTTWWKYSQKCNHHYAETYFSKIKMETINAMLMSMASFVNWVISLFIL